MLPLLGGQVRRTLKFNTEKPTVVIHQKPHSPKPVSPVLRVIFFSSAPSLPVSLNSQPSLHRYYHVHYHIIKTSTSFQ